MKKFILKTVLLSSILAGFCFAVVYMAPINPDNYYASAIDKDRRLAETPPPRLILIGDSNTCFNLDSEAIERQTGFNVINTGIHLQLGYQYIINETKPFLRAGDTVIICFGYDHMLLSGSGGFALIETTMFYPHAFRNFTRENFISYIKYYPESLQRRFFGLFSTSGQSIYRRTGFNKYGDLVSHLSADSPFVTTSYLNSIFAEYQFPKDSLDKIENINLFIRFINDFKTFCDKKNVTLYYTYAPFPRYLFIDRGMGKDLLKMTAYFNARTKVNVVGKPEDYLRELDDLYDTHYHLNRIGREKNTAVFLHNFEFLHAPDKPR